MPAWAIFCDSSARASCTSFCTSLPNCSTASPNSRGIALRSFDSAMALPFAALFERVRLGVAVAGFRRRALEEAQRCEAQNHRAAEEERRLTPGKILHLTDQLAHVALADGVGNTLHLFGRLANVARGLGQLSLEFMGRTFRRLRD